MIDFILIAILWLLSGIIGSSIIILNDAGEIKVKDIPFILEVGMLGFFTLLFVLLFFSLDIFQKYWNKWWKTVDQEKVLYSSKRKKEK
jgi:hypothetical protein